jgi:hypothetical protein
MGQISPRRVTLSRPGIRIFNSFSIHPPVTGMAAVASICRRR